MNFSYKQKQDVFCQYKYCYRITKVQNGLYNLGYCHATDGPPKMGPPGPSVANYVAMDGPPGPSTAAIDGPPGPSVAP